MTVEPARRTEQWLLPALCVVAFLLLAIEAVDVFGFGGRAWFGYWDSVTVMTTQPFVAEIVQTVPGGAAARAGLRDGDRVNLRDLDANGRVALLFQPMATRSIDLIVRRGPQTFKTRFTGSTQWEVQPLFKIGVNVLWLVGYFLALVCAALIAVRRAQTIEGRLLCITLLVIVGSAIGPSNTVLPDGRIDALMVAISGIFTAISAVLPVALSARFGVRHGWRRLVELAVYAIAATVAASGIACTIGLIYATIDPLPFVFGTFWRTLVTVLYAATTIAVATAVASTSPLERPRAAWLLLPLPIGLLLYTLAGQTEALATSWSAFMALAATSNTLMLAGAAAVTYALLKRRVLDVQFVISRTLVVAGVSAIVVASFVLLEWFLGNVLVNASHVTGVVANAALALVLGLSMQFIHQRVNALVEFAFFHRRHEADRALRDFGKEAAYVTQREVLLDLTIEIVEHQTDARAASLLVNGDGTYRAVRWFGEQSADAAENDAAILALKAWHKPLDPHRYASTLAGDVALPLLARGRLVGVLLCGERSRGEAYAPDEIDALTELAHGVGTALDALERTDGVAARESAILAELRALREAIERTNPAP